MTKKGDTNCGYKDKSLYSKESLFAIDMPLLQLTQRLMPIIFPGHVVLAEQLLLQLIQRITLSLQVKIRQVSDAQEMLPDIPDFK